MHAAARWTGCAVCVLVLAAAPAAAQELPRATPTLPADHWAVQAARTVHEMGLAEAHFPASGNASMAAVDAALRGAADAPPGGVEALLTHWLARWEEEVGRFPFGGPLRVGGGAGVDAVSERGVAAPGDGLIPGAEQGPAVRDPYTGAEAAASAWMMSGYFTASASPGVERNGVRLQAGEAAVLAGPIRLSIVRLPAAYAQGIVIHPAAAFDRAEIALEGPITLPGPLRHLGPVTAHTFAGRLDDERHGDRPWLWGARAAMRPHPRFTIGINRAAMLGGDENPTPFTFGNAVRTFVGMHVDDLADQIVSVDARWRLPTGGVPATAYMEGGAEDSSGAWYKTPAVVVGLHLPAVPGAPNLALGVERAYVSRSCEWRWQEVSAGEDGPCANPPWYRHRQFTGGWVVGERMLGLPVGGNGGESALYGRLSLPTHALEVAGRAFLRHRGRDNLFAPQREGRSAGGALRADWRPLPRSAVRLEVHGDVGGGWSEFSARAGVHTYF